MVLDVVSQDKVASLIFAKTFTAAIGLGGEKANAYWIRRGNSKGGDSVKG